MGVCSLASELSLISYEPLRNFVSLVLLYVPDYFFTVAASTSGKHHPQYALGEGGLLRHVQAAVTFAERMLGLEQNKSVFDEWSRDVIYASIILHDCWKCGKTPEGENGEWRTTFLHPTIAAEEIGRIAANFHFTNQQLLAMIEEVQRAVASHMGQWNTDEKYNPGLVLPKPETLVEEMVHLCDYLASRKDFEYVGRQA